MAGVLHEDEDGLSMRGQGISRILAGVLCQCLILTC